jgi:hypothetical protein
MLTYADGCRYVKAMIADMGVPEDVAVKYWLTKRREKVSYMSLNRHRPSSAAP